MDPNQLTQKSQEALHDAQTKALRFGHTEIDVEHLLLALLDQSDGLVPRLLQRAEVDIDGLRPTVEQALERRPRVSGAGQGQADLRLALARTAARPRRSRRPSASRTSTSRSSTCCWRCSRPMAPRARVLREHGAHARALPGGADRDPRRPARHVGHRRRPRTRRWRSTAATSWPRRGAASWTRDRARRGDPAHDPDPQPQDQEQPGADRRAGRRQDRDRRGAGAADRQRRRARGAEGQDRLRARHVLAGRGRQVPRRVRGAPAGRAGRDQGRRGRASCCSSTSCTRSSARAPPRARWTRATCSSRCSPAASCTASAPPRSPSTASTSRRTPRSSAASSPCMVDEPTVEDTISILRGLRERFEVHHGVRIQDASLVAAATLSHRYITDRFLPDKAIDLVDEACAVVRTEIDSMPQELDQITRRVMRLEIEEAALSKETDEASRRRLEALRSRARGPASSGQRDARPVGGRAQRDPQAAGAARGDRPGPARDRGRRTPLRPQPRGGAALRHAAGARAPAARRGGAPDLQAGRHAVAARGGDRGRDRRDRRALDRNPGLASDGGRAREAAASRRDPARARDRPGGGGAARRRRDHPRARRHQGPEAPDRLVHLPRPNRRGQDGALARARRGAVRLRGQHRPSRHVRVSGAPHRQPARRRAPRATSATTRAAS